MDNRQLLEAAKVVTVKAENFFDFIRKHSCRKTGVMNLHSTHFIANQQVLQNLICILRLCHEGELRFNHRKAGCRLLKRET